MSALCQQTLLSHYRRLVCSLAVKRRSSMLALAGPSFQCFTISGWSSVVSMTPTSSVGHTHQINPTWEGTVGEPNTPGATRHTCHEDDWHGDYFPQLAHFSLAARGVVQRVHCYRQVYFAPSPHPEGLKFPLRQWIYLGLPTWVTGSRRGTPTRNTAKVTQERC